MLGMLPGSIGQLVLGADEVGAIPTPMQGMMPAIVALVVFLLVFGVLSLKVWPTITKALDERAAKITEEIEAAEMARRQAKDALEQYQKSLEQARAEATKMLEATRAQQQQLAAELKTKADAELSQMRERAMRDIDQARRAAVSEIYADASNLATMMAGKILRRQMTQDDHAQLLDESLAQLQTLKN
ncbi:MAG: F0F1 ATP synthase subunit B [Phycisphaerales bacterium]|nr:F0F1 ATP synthase subunit B [Phycisphaerales bacterium]NUQ66847.1 F0F1 ATP synthase subunit B [Phycisphaerales bacterium]